MKKTLLIPALLAALTAQAQTPQLVYDIVSGPTAGDPVFITPFNNKLHFIANDGTNGRELWSYDGTNTPAMVYNLNPGAANGAALAYNQKMGTLGNKLYFAANNGTSGEELFVYDGTNPPSLAADIESGTGNSAPRAFVTIGNKIYFRAGTVLSGSELYSYDGTNPPTKFDINTGAASSSPANLTEYNGKLYFSASTIANGSELFVYDPATNAYSMVQDINSGAASSSPAAFLVANGKLWFVAASAANGGELYSYDGTTVTRVTDVAAGTLTGAASGSLGFLNGQIYFAGSTDGTNAQLYRFDPGTGSATLVYNINPGGSAIPSLFTSYAGKLYFQATTTAAGQELWMTDGTTTAMVADMLSGASGSAPSDFVVWNGNLYMNTTNGTSGYELYRLFDPAGIVNTTFDGTIRLYPNPAQEAANLEISLPNSAVISVQLTDVTGRRVWAKEATAYAAGNSVIELPMQKLAVGAYYYRLTDGSGRLVASGKVMKD